MNLFNISKLKIESEIIESITKYNIDYYKIKEAEKLKVSIFRDIMGNNLCLAIIDSKLQYKEVNGSIDELIANLETLNISYRKKMVKEDENIKILGISMKVSSETKTKRYILGFVFSIECIDKIKEITKDYNIYNYMDFSNTDSDELLNRIEIYYEDEEELFIQFGLSVFDSKAFNNLSIKVSPKYFQLVNEIIDRLKKDYN